MAASAIGMPASSHAALKTSMASKTTCLKYLATGATNTTF
jgi:hypothetical protein